MEELIKKYPTKGWNIMVVLDGCRYDYFKEVNFIPGTLLKVFNGNCVDTITWYKKHFFNKKHEDIVLIHGKYFVEKAEEYFYKCYPMWDYDTMLNIDQQIKYVEYCLKEIEDKRVLIHFLQPHLPFCNPEGRKFLEEEIKTSLKGKPEDYTKVTNYCRKYGWERLKELYKKEIRYILSKIYYSNINPDVITSDHGVRLGEDNIFRHNVVHPAVVNVPYLIVRKDVKNDY